MSALRMVGVGRRFGNRQVLAGIDLDVAPGQRVALLGPNGSGKTTLLRIAAGLLRPSQGMIEAAPVAYVSQDAPLYPELTAAEHAAWWSRLHDRPPIDVGPLASVRGTDLSRGQRQRLHLEMALACGSELLLLDEPFTGLDAAGAAWLEERLQKHTGAIVIALHDEVLAQRLCHDALHLEAM